MSNYLFWTVSFYLTWLSFLSEGGKIPEKEQQDSDRPVFHDFTGGQLERALDEALMDDHRESKAAMTRKYYDLEKELEEASRDDVHVLPSLSNSIFNSYVTNDFEDLFNSLRIEFKDDSTQKSLALDRVEDGEIPPGIDVHEYTSEERKQLIRLYHSHRLEDRKALFQFIARHTHNKLMNCARNFGRWITNPRFDEPIFYRNCVPCTNTVDLNLQSLFNNDLRLQHLKHYFVNTCDMSNKWISYAGDMEYLKIDLKRHRTATFTDVIRQHLIPNYRYVFQGLVRSELAHQNREFFHACNLIHDEHGQIWIIDGQIERVFDFQNPNDLKELDQRYRPDYITRAPTGLFLPPSLIKRTQRFS